MREHALKRPEPGKWQSAVLAAGMHLLLGLFLFYSVRWQTSKPAAVQVELIEQLSADIGQFKDSVTVETDPRVNALALETHQLNIQRIFHQTEAFAF